MKTLHISIIAGIVVIASTSIGIFIEKIGENPQQPYVGITINGLKENYTLNEPITFSVQVEGYGAGCGDTKAILTKENNSQFKSPVWGFGQQCTSSIQLHNFKFSALPVNTSINETGNYTLTAIFDDFITSRHAQMEQEFSVISPKTHINDTGVYSFSAAVANTNSTINYNISGNNKLLDAKMDLQSKSLILSLQSTHNGTLILSIPRTLLDIKKNDRGMGEFYMLADGQETDFKEIYTSLTDRTFSIPFQNGTKSIEIIATELI